MFEMVSRVLLVLVLSICVGRSAQAQSEADVDIAPSGPGESVLIVFLHGILGDAKSSFKADSNSKSWPEMVAVDTSLGARVRVVSLSYQSGPLKTASNIHEIATRLGTRIQTKELIQNSGKVIFVTHSMGGLIARHLLLQMARDNPQDFAKVSGVFFLATPSGGSDAAQLASWISRNPQFQDMVPTDLNTFMQSDEDEWAALLRKRTPVAPYPKTYCVYEKQAVGPLVVVPRSRALIGCDDRPITFERNHINIVKPASNRDEVYEYVNAKVKRLIRDEDLPLQLGIYLTNAAGVIIPQNVALRSGEQYAIVVNTLRPAWIYVFGEDGRAMHSRYFPSKAGGSQTTPIRSIRIPQDNKALLTLDSHPGTERLTVVASLSPRPELEKSGVELGAKKGGPTPELTSVLSKRGSVVEPAKSAVTRLAPQQLVIDAKATDVVGYFAFAHEP